MSLPASVMYEELRRSTGFFPAHECKLAVQPILRIKQPGISDINGVEWLEFLIRPHGRFSNLTPDRFVRQIYAGQIGLDLDRMVVGVTLGWIARQDRRIRASVNIHPSSLSNADFVDYVLRSLDEFDLDPHQLCLELVEFAEPVCISRIRSGVRDIKDAGVLLALDDYGKGLPNFDLCGEGAVDFIKIDRAFVEHVNVNAHHEALIRGIFALASEMGIEVVAEGIERATQLTTLRRIGVQWSQGFLLQRPTLIDL